jgi:hypothetical protein
MTADRSRRDILVYATLAARAMALTALGANAVDVPSKYRIRAGARFREVNCASAPRADQPPKMRMILSHPCCWDNRPAKPGHHNMLDNRPSGLIHTLVSDFPF